MNLLEGVVSKILKKSLPGYVLFHVEKGKKYILVLPDETDYDDVVEVLGEFLKGTDMVVLISDNVRIIEVG